MKKIRFLSIIFLMGISSSILAATSYSYLYIYCGGSESSECTNGGLTSVHYTTANGDKGSFMIKQAAKTYQSYAVSSPVASFYLKNEADGGTTKSITYSPDEQNNEQYNACVYPNTGSEGGEAPGLNGPVPGQSCNP